jgi:hypothetical protein
LAPADRGGKSRSRRPRTSSIRDAAQRAAGSGEAPGPGEGADASAAGSGPPRKPKTPGARPKLRSRTAEATRRAAEQASRRPPEQPPREAPFPDYNVTAEAWDPWEADPTPTGRPDPDFDAQRTLGEWLEGVIPPDAQVHFVNAGREFAQGVQVTVDHHTGKRRPSSPEQTPPGPSRIEID